MKTLLDREDLVFNPPELGCVLCLPGLPGGASKIYDRSPYGNHGTITGATWTRLPSGLWCLSFDALDDYVDAGLSTDLSGGGDFTIEGWFKASYDDRRYAASQSHTIAPYSSDWIIMESQTTSLFWMRSVTLAAPTGFDGTKWNHLVLAWNKTTGTYEGFVNGVSVGTSGTVSGYGGVGSVKIASSGDGTSTFWGGLSALVTIYRRLLSTLEIQNHFNQEKHLFGVC